MALVPVVRIRPLLLLSCLAAFSLMPGAWADENHCTDTPKQSQYVPQPGDVEGMDHLSLSRPFDGSGRLELDVCAGQLRVRPSRDGQLHVELQAGQRTPSRLRAYLKRVDVGPGRAVIEIQVPGKFHPEVTVDVPATPALQSEVNLGAGDLKLNANGFPGRKEVNVGAGNATIYLDGDHDYSHLEANVGMGSFRDHRPGGSSSHLVISRNLTGSGAAALEVNVGAGSVDLKQAE
jgi:hypothetical protein